MSGAVFACEIPSSDYMSSLPIMPALEITMSSRFLGEFWTAASNAATKSSQFMMSALMNCALLEAMAFR